MPGSPIRTPPDHSSVDSSPGPIAASHVLHRLLVPRHPPCALKHLHTQQTTHETSLQDARIHYPVHKHPTNPKPTTTTHQTPTPQDRSDGGMRPGLHPAQKTTKPAHKAGLLPSGPNSVPNPPPTHRPPTSRHESRTQNVNDVSTHEHHHRTFAGETGLAPARPLQARSSEMLLRKEVIQPHLPVRLPCYDFVPIASPTFDHSLPQGLGHGLRVLPTFVT